MIITNNLNLPEPVYTAIAKSQSRRREGDFSVTELIDSPRVVTLTRRHQDEIVQDAMDLLWSFWGTASHNVMANPNCSGDTETRLTSSIILASGEVVGISGTPDYVDATSILDYKFTSVWSWVFKSRLKKWEEQLQLYNYLYNYKARKLINILIFKDFDKNKAKQEGDYPFYPIISVEYPTWDKDILYKFVLSLVEKHVNAKELEDKYLPQCSDEEMWARPTTYAVVPTGAKRAARVFDSVIDADEYARICSKTCDIVERLGRRVRCEEYCNVAPFCNQYKEYRDGQSTTG